MDLANSNSNNSSNNGNSSLGLKLQSESNGFRVKGIVPFGIASKSKILVGDLIVSLDGKKLTTAGAMPLLDFEKGSVAIEYVRNGIKGFDIIHLNKKKEFGSIASTDVSVVSSRTGGASSYGERRKSSVLSLSGRVTPSSSVNLNLDASVLLCKAPLINDDPVVMSHDAISVDGDGDLDDEKTLRVHATTQNLVPRPRSAGESHRWLKNIQRFEAFNSSLTSTKTIVIPSPATSPKPQPFSPSHFVSPKYLSLSPKHLLEKENNKSTLKRPNTASGSSVKSEKRDSNKKILQTKVMPTPSGMLEIEADRRHHTEAIISREYDKMLSLDSKGWDQYELAKKKRMETAKWPGMYLNHDPNADVGGGKFNESNPKGELDWILYRAHEIPGPGEYDLAKSSFKQGFRFNQSPFKRVFDQITHANQSIPGPATYLPKPDPLPQGGKFNVSNSKSELEWTLYHARRLPGPADYDTRSKSCEIQGGRFNTAKSKTGLEWEIYRSSQLPGPGDYNVRSSVAKTEGGTISKTSGKSEIETLIMKASRSPGPANYETAANIAKRPGGRFNKSKTFSLLEKTILRGAETPGPGQYCIPEVPKQNSLPLAKVATSSIEEVIEKGKRAPGPGDYNDGRKYQSKGGIISLAKKMSPLDLEMKRAASVPGIGHYPTPPLPAPKGGEFKPVGKRDFDMIIERASKLPGPADYQTTTLPRGQSFVAYYPENKMLH